jgi:hypothetical protein
MIQIRQTKNDLAAKGLLILLAHTSGLHAAGMLARVCSARPAGQARIVGECTGDLALTENEMREVSYIDGQSPSRAVVAFIVLARYCSY